MIKTKPRVTTNRLFIHASHTPPSVGDTADIVYGRPSCKDIGYHFVIERSGTAVAGVPLDKIGYHTPGFNLQSIGICLIGGKDEDGFARDNFTPAQRETLVTLIVMCIDKYPLILSPEGHTEVQSYTHEENKQCPPIDMEELRQDVSLALHYLANRRPIPSAKWADSPTPDTKD